MPRLPFHKYLGPGNDLNEGEPINSADAIARLHDNQYENVKTSDDVFRADEDAIEHFTHDFLHTHSIPSAIGAAGLFLKNRLERYTGIIYPFR